MADVRLTGITPEKLDQKLFFVAAAMRNKAIKASLLAQSKVVEQKAKRGAPKKPRNAPASYNKAQRHQRRLRQSIGVKQLVYQGGSLQMVIVGPRTNAPWHKYYAHAVEAGHDVRHRKTGKKRKGDTATTAKVPGKAFMVPAAEGTKGQQRRAFLSTLESHMEAASK